MPCNFFKLSLLSIAQRTWSFFMCMNVLLLMLPYSLSVFHLCRPILAAHPPRVERKQKRPEINTRNSGDERPIEPGKRKCVMGELWACQCIDGNGKLWYFHLAFVCPSKFLIGKPHPVPYRQRTQFWLKKNFPDRLKLLAKRTSKPMYIKGCWARGCHGNSISFPVKLKPSFLK